MRRGYRTQVMADTQDIQWQLGHFFPFRATRDVALPEIDGIPQPGLRKDEVIQYDGTILKRAGDPDRPLPQLKGCLTKQWIVPADDHTTEYVPQPAGVKVHSATQMGNDRPEGATLAVASEDMAEVGKIGQRIEARKRPGDQIAAKAVAQKTMSASARKMLRELDVVASQFGVTSAPEPAAAPAPPPAAPQAETFTAAELPSPAKKFPIDMHEQQSVGPAIRKVDRTAETAGLEISGQQEAIRNTQVVVDSTREFAGADKLGSEVQVGKPGRKKTASDGKARAGKLVMEIEGEEPQEGVVLASFSKPVTSPEIKDGSAARREAARLDSTTQGKKTKFTVTAEDEGEVVGDDSGAVPVADGGEIELDDFEPEAAPEPAGEIPADFAAKLASAKMFVPKFAWDITRSWQDRVKDAMENYVKKPNWMRAILAVETPDVQRTLRGNLKKLGVDL